MSEQAYKEGFNKGYLQLRQKDVKDATKKIWEALGINNRNSFLQYRVGMIEPKASQAATVEAVFAEYEISEVWGKVD